MRTEIKLVLDAKRGDRAFPIFGQKGYFDAQNQVLIELCALTLCQKDGKMAISQSFTYSVCREALSAMIKAEEQEKQGQRSWPRE